MHIKNNALGSLYILLGLLIFMVFAGQWLLRLAMIMLALYLINYGLMLRGIFGFRSFIIQCVDKSSFY